jgi:surfactin synthase thioesterase subunit
MQNAAPKFFRKPFLVSAYKTTIKHQAPVSNLQRLQQTLEMSGYSFGCVLAHQMAYQLSQARIFALFSNSQPSQKTHAGRSRCSPGDV